MLTTLLEADGFRFTSVIRQLGDGSDHFIAQANAFIDGMEGKATPLSTFDEAVQTLRFNIAALRSVSTGLPISIP